MVAGNSIGRRLIGLVAVQLAIGWCQVAPVDCSGELSARDNQAREPAAGRIHDQPAAGPKRRKPTKDSPAACNYDKGPWDECNAQGVQRRALRLSAELKSAPDCEPTKWVRRDCKAAGCKYARGAWSPSCSPSGQRVRVDTLVGRLGNATHCKPQRRVTKDCGRTCHYTKSAWSDCSNGFQTRNLTLDERPPAADKPGHAHGREPAPPAGGSCAARKLVRRACRRPGAARGPTPAAGRTQTAPAANQKRRRRLKQQQTPALGPRPPSGPGRGASQGAASKTKRSSR